MIYKFELGRNAGIAILTDNYPEEFCYADNNPVATVGRGVALRIQTGEDRSETTEIVMNKEQTKAIIKALKMQLKILRRTKT